MALGFVDLEKAFDTVPREMVMATLRWMGVPEAEVKMVEGICTRRQQQEWWWEKEHRRSLRSRWTQARQRAEPAAVHISTGPHKQEDGDEGCHKETPLCRRPGPCGEWQTGATRDTAGVEREVYLTLAEDKPTEDGSAAHRPPEGRAGHRAGGEETDSGGQFCVPRRGSVRRREDGERGTSKSTGRSERMESS